MKICKVCLLSLIAQFYATAEGANEITDPDAGMRRLYMSEKTRVATSLGRFGAEHSQRRAFAQKSGRGNGELSLIWYEPVFYGNEFASVFWNTNEIIVALMDRGMVQTRAYPTDLGMRTLREQLVDRIGRCDYAFPLGGDVNEALIGVFHDSTNSVFKGFSILTGQVYNSFGVKRFYGSDDSVAMYKILAKLRCWLRGKMVRRYGLLYLFDKPEFARFEIRNQGEVHLQEQALTCGFDTLRLVFRVDRHGSPHLPVYLNVLSSGHEGGRKLMNDWMFKRADSATASPSDGWLLKAKELKHSMILCLDGLDIKISGTPSAFSRVDISCCSTNMPSSICLYQRRGSTWHRVSLWNDCLTNGVQNSGIEYGKRNQ